MRGQKRVFYFHANENKKKVRVPILISDKIEFLKKIVTQDKGGHNIIIKGSIQEEDITNVNTTAPNIGAPKYIKQIINGHNGRK